MFYAERNAGGNVSARGFQDKIVGGWSVHLPPQSGKNSGSRFVFVS